MSVDVGSAVGYLDLDITGFLNGLKTAQTEGSKTNKTFATVGKDISSFGEKIKKVGGGMTKTFTIPVVTALTAVVNQYGKLEQAVGGIETLFEESAGVVIENSETAYMRAGVSGVTYMEQVTSFSARLLQGLGGDTVEAARVADMAMVDMADNANKFGTDIGSIQNAYQGFAKANFSMLDNLKLGYGGTASEMARLVNESGVLEGAMEATAENVKEIPFDVLIKAINKTQKRMGIFGTTSKEATETVSGSFGSLKAAVTDFIGGMGDANADTSRLAGNMVETFRTFAGNVIRVLKNIWDNLPISDTTKKIIGLVAVAGPILVIGGKIVTVVGGIVTAIGAINGAMALLAANPVMLFILGGAAAVAAIALITTAITDAFGKAGQLKKELDGIDMTISEESKTAIGNGIDAGIELADKTFEVSLAVDTDIEDINTKVSAAFQTVIDGAKAKLSTKELTALKKDVKTFVGGAIDEVKTTTDAKVAEVTAAMDSLGVSEEVKKNATAGIIERGNTLTADLQEYERQALALLGEMGKAGEGVTQDQIDAFEALMLQIGAIKKEIGLMANDADGMIIALKDKIARGVATEEEVAIVTSFDLRMGELKTEQAQKDYEEKLELLGIALQAASEEDKPEIQLQIDFATEEFNAATTQAQTDATTDLSTMWDGIIASTESGQEAMNNAAYAANVYATLQQMFDMPEGFDSLGEDAKAEVTAMLLNAVPHLTEEQINAPMAPIGIYAMEAMDAINSNITAGAAEIGQNETLKTALNTMLESSALDNVDLTKLPDTLKGALAATNFSESGGVIGEDVMSGLGLGFNTGTPGAEGEVTTAMAAIIAAAKAELGVQSPSTVFDEIGQNNMLGLDQGHATGAETVKTNLGTYFETMWTDLATSFATQIKALLLVVDTAFATMPEKISVHTALVETNVDTWGTSMSKKAKDIGDDFVLKFITPVNKLPAKMLIQTNLILTRLTTWGTNIGKKGTTAGENLTTKTETGAKKLPPKMLTIGEQVITGFWDGINNKISWLEDQIDGLVDTITAKIKKEFGISSPAKRIADEIGVYIPPGLVVGVKEAMPKAMHDIQTAITKGMGGVDVPAIESAGVEVKAMHSVSGFVDNLKQLYEQIAVWFESVEARMVASIDRMTETLQGFVQKSDILVNSDGTLGYIPAGGFPQTVRVEDGREETRREPGEGDTFNFYSPKALSEIEAARQMKQAKRDLAEGF